MENIWERFDSIVDSSEVEKAREEAKERSAKFSPLEAGDYNVKLEDVVAGESQSGLPMLKMKFRTIEGNRVIFYNAVLENLSYPEYTARNIANAVDLLSGIVDEDLEFTTVSSLGAFIGTLVAHDGDDKPTAISEKVLPAFTVSLWYGKTDLESKFPKINFKSKIVEAVDSSEFVSVPDGVDDEVPFL